MVEDVKREPLSYDRLIAAQPRARPRRSRRHTRRARRSACCCPTSPESASTFFALQALGRVPAMLNYTAGLANLKAACTAAEIRTIVTARAFVDQAKLGDVVARRWRRTAADPLSRGYRRRASAPAQSCARCSPAASPAAARQRIVARRAGGDPVHQRARKALPKGVVLSHRNLLANCHQLAARIDFNASDVVLNALPVFHSFGLTGGTLLPILNGVRTLLYPSPLHYRIVPALAYDANATILFGTDTFLAGYAAHGAQLRFLLAALHLRRRRAGPRRDAQDLCREVRPAHPRRLWRDRGRAGDRGQHADALPRRHRRPAAARRSRRGSSRCPGSTRAAGCSIRGPNVMAGYLKVDAPGVLQPPEDGWHDTGDIVTIDEEGFVTIRGRAKRFAKIGGEMVSLPAVEGYAAAVWPEADHAVVTRARPTQGRAAGPVHHAQGCGRGSAAGLGRANGVTELAHPRRHPGASTPCPCWARASSIMSRCRALADNS